jgi:hypothetical protein
MTEEFNYNTMLSTIADEWKTEAIRLKIFK